jgi:hypothetical protein
MGTGLSVFNMESDDAFPTDVAAVAVDIDQLLAQVVQLLPSSITVQVANEMEVRDNATGGLTKTVSGVVPAARAGALGATGYAAGVGCRLRWNTDGVRNGRPVTGTTFVVPIASAMYEANGTLTASAITPLQTGASTLITALQTSEAPLAVWSKPSTDPVAAGVLNPVVSAGVPDQVSWLTSRRH